MVVAWGREEFLVLHKVSFVSRIFAAVPKAVSSETMGPVKFHRKAQKLKTTDLGLEAVLLRDTWLLARLLSEYV